jgi:SAM-dependent methyltransferase
VTGTEAELFARLGAAYDAVFAQEVAATEAQADFLVRALGLRPGQRLLDVGCGPGRHSLALARRGLAVTGLDREGALLDLARRRAAAEGLHVHWVAADARRMPRLGPFAAAICLFASWGYARDPAEDGRVLGGVARNLAPGGRFVLDVPHVAWLEAHPRGRTLSLAGGTAVRERRAFDPATRRLAVHWRVREPAGAWEAELEYRVYGVEELEWMLAATGLVLEAAYGGYDGAPLSASRPRAVVLSRRPVLPLGPAARP